MRKPGYRKCVKCGAYTPCIVRVLKEYVAVCNDCYDKLPRQTTLITENDK